LWVTLQYTSPEQLQGKEADARSDIFSFGAVLYEMLSGKRAFGGSNAASVIAAVLERQPAPLELSPPLGRVIRACLEKDPEQRIQSARDAKRALEWAAEPALAVAKAARSRFALAGWIAVVLLVAAGWILWPRSAPPARLVRFDVPLPDKVNSGQYVSVSPDGRKLVLAAGNGGLWIRNLDSCETCRLLPPGHKKTAAPLRAPASRWRIGN